MPNETNTIIVSRSIEEDKGTSGVVQEVFAAENCSAECPTCQQSCALTAAAAGARPSANGQGRDSFPPPFMRGFLFLPPSTAPRAVCIKLPRVFFFSLPAE